MKSGSEVLKTVSQLRFGDLIEVEWSDASKREIRLHPKVKGKRHVFDVPVRSVGFFFGLVGDEVKHIAVARDIFCWPGNGDFDVDLTAIPLGMTKGVRVIMAGVLDPKLCFQLKTAFERGTVRIVKRGRQLRLHLVGGDVA